MRAHVGLLLSVLIASTTFSPFVFAKPTDMTDTTIIQSSDTGAVMLELYTSQGCHSCPPAEKWINKFSEYEGLWNEVIPINLHVDYWDYLGWKDPFARAEFSKRQRLYRHYRHTRNVATPGFVINGKGWSGWFWGKSLPRSPLANNGKLVAQVDKQALSVSLVPTEASYRAPMVHVAVLGFGIETEVPRGENAGKRLKHDFVVVGYHTQKLAKGDDLTWMSKMSKPDTVDVAMSRQALVVWVTNKHDPTPIQVAANWL